ncbi:TniQ family protein [Kitasatospora sp. NPDC098652]|uniref:TniQ family protein n=1 Tax=Kitasatospora sp. NPDC098652 TaxID=3364095 RepID=UPI0037FB4D83
MTAWGPQRIPIWVPPLPGEALDSWLAAYAARLTVPMGSFLRYLGLPDADLARMMRLLSAHERKVISSRTSLAGPELAARTLEPWDGLAVAIDPSTRSLRQSAFSKSSGSNTRFCPACLEENGGRWQTSWRLAWTFACLRHHFILADLCPACHKPPILHKHLVVPEPGRCLQGTGDQRCGFPYAQASATSSAADGPVVWAQRWVNETVLDFTRDRQEALQRSGELALLSRRALTGLLTHLATVPPRVRDIIDDAGGSVPAVRTGHRFDLPSGHHMAVGLAIAASALGEGAGTDEGVLTWVLSTKPRAEKTYPITWAHRWAKGSPQLAARVVAEVDEGVSLMTRLRYGTTTGAPSWPTLTSADVERRAACLPSMLWPSWTARILPPTGPMTNLVAGLQRAAASLLLLPDSACTYPKAASMLGNTRIKANWDALKVVTASQETVLVTLLVHLARAMDQHGSPIDYRRRRELFAHGDLVIDDSAVVQYCRKNGINPGSEAVRTKHLRWRVRRLLLGADPGTYSRTPVWHRRTAHLIDSDLAALLRDQACANLRYQRIDEPLVWEPPTDWIPELDWPGLVPERVDHKAMSALVAKRPSLHDLAAMTGTGTEQLRLYLESADVSIPPPPPAATERSRRRTPVSRPSTPRARTGQGIRVALVGVLEPAELRRLYVDEGLSTPKIAKMAGCTSATVGRIMKEAGIPTRRRQGPMLTAEGAPVTAEWLRREYVDRGRDTPDIASELGCHNAMVSHMMKRFGIPARPLFATANRFARLQVPLSPAMTAIVAMRNHVQRMRHLIQLPGHHDLATASRAMDVPYKSLRYQLNAVEEAAGFRIVERVHPLMPTVQGREFLAEARRLLHLLDADTTAHGTPAVTSPAARPVAPRRARSGGRPGR